MKAISKCQHQSLMEAFKQLESLLQADDVIADGFIAQKQSLVELYRHYEALLSELAECIRQYGEEHHHLKVNVLAPALRQVKRKKKSGIQNGKSLENIPELARAMQTGFDR